MPFVFRWLLNSLYLLIVLAIAPFLVYRRITQGKYRRGWSQKLTGRVERRYPDRMCLWFHAVSVGEVLQLQKVLEETRSRFPDAEFFLTVTTETGYDLAKTKYPESTVSFFPLDFSWAVSNALNAIRPDLMVLVLINGRMGEKSFRGYLRIRPLMKRLLSCFEVLAVQTETYADRLKSLGAPEDRVIVTGNIKFDRVETDRSNPKTTELRRGFGLNDSDRVLIAGSTQDPEEDYAIESWLALRKDLPRLRLIIVPRHKERFEEVASLIRKRGCSVVRRSEIVAGKSASIAEIPADQPVVFLVDTLGELAACWGLADIAFVGGSLTNRGGQNMIEPAGYGAAVLFGPNTWNFKDVTEALLSQNAARVVTGPDEMRETILLLLKHPEEANGLGEAARTFVVSQRGATVRTVNLITKALHKTSENQGGSNSSGAQQTDHPSRFRSYWPILKWALFAIVFIFVGRRAMQLWDSAPPESVRIHWPWLFAASGFYFAGWIPSVCLWRALLLSLNQPLDWWTAFRAYYVGHMGKYIPGKALVLVIRGSMVSEAEVNPLLAGLTAAYETLIFMATGAALCLAISPWVFGHPLWNENQVLPYWLQSPWLVTLIVIAGTFATTPLSAWLFSRVGRKRFSNEDLSGLVDSKISAGLVSWGVLITSVGWVCHAFSLGCVLQAFSDYSVHVNQFPGWLYACTLSTVGGFVVLIAPGGLGVREGLLIEALKGQPETSPASAVIAAGLLRAVWFATELTVAAIFYVAKPKGGQIQSFGN